MPARHDLDPGAMTDEERRAKRRYQAGHAFEQMPGPLDWERCGAVMPGHVDDVLHRCAQRDGHPGTRHQAPASLDPASRHVWLSVSWHDPIMEWDGDA